MLHAKDINIIVFSMKKNICWENEPLFIILGIKQQNIDTPHTCNSSRTEVREERGEERERHKERQREDKKMIKAM